MNEADLLLAGGLLATALTECENALADYIPTLEKQGAELNYGRSVLRQAELALANWTRVSGS